MTMMLPILPKGHRGFLVYGLDKVIRYKLGDDPVRLAAWYGALSAARRRMLARHHEIQRGRCAVCLRATWLFPDVGFKGCMATLEHFVPQSMRGTDHYDNTLMTCADCNHRRGDEDIYVFYDRFVSTGRRRDPALRRIRSPKPVDTARLHATLWGLVALFHLVPGLAKTVVDEEQDDQERDVSRSWPSSVNPAPS